MNSSRMSAPLSDTLTPLPRLPLRNRYVMDSIVLNFAVSITLAWAAILYVIAQMMGTCQRTVGVQQAMAALQITMALIFALHTTSTVFDSSAYKPDHGPAHLSDEDCVSFPFFHIFALLLAILITLIMASLRTLATRFIANDKKNQKVQGCVAFSVAAILPIVVIHVLDEGANGTASVCIPKRVYPQQASYDIYSVFRVLLYMLLSIITVYLYVRKMLHLETLNNNTYLSQATPAYLRSVKNWNQLNLEVTFLEKLIPVIVIQVSKNLPLVLSVLLLGLQWGWYLAMVCSTTSLLPIMTMTLWAGTDALWNCILIARSLCCSR